MTVDSGVVPLSLERFQDALEGRVSNLILFESLQSTHLAAQRLIEQVDTEGAPLHPTLILSAGQSDGRGREQRQWASPPGGLYLNWVAGDLEKQVVQLLPMLAATAVHRALSAIGIENATIKWPNDLLVEGRKIAGILVHARHGDTVFATVGVGVNVLAAPDLPEGDPTETISVADLVDLKDPNESFVTLVETFLEALKEGMSSAGPALDHWRRHLVHQVGDAITVRLSSGETVSGSFVGVEPEGFIRIDTGEGEKILTGGDVIETSSSAE